MKSKRWNFETGESSLLVCREYHEKGATCQYEPLSPSETLELLDYWRATALRLHGVLTSIAESDKPYNDGSPRHVPRGVIILTAQQAVAESV